MEQMIVVGIAIFWLCIISGLLGLVLGDEACQEFGGLYLCIAMLIFAFIVWFAFVMTMVYEIT